MKKFYINILFLTIFLFPVFTTKAEPIDSTVWSLLKNRKSPIVLSYNNGEGWDTPNEECGLGDVGKYWTFPLIVGMKLTAFKEELSLYCKTDTLPSEVSLDWHLRLFSAYSITNGGNWDEHWLPYRNKETGYDIKLKALNQFKKKKIRKSVWKFIEPALAHQIKNLKLRFKGIVVLAMEYVRNYFIDYDQDAAIVWYYMDEETSKFAHQDYHGETHPARKITAFIERLMFKWQICNLKDVRYWSNYLQKWLKKTLGNDYQKSLNYWDLN